MMLSMIYHPGPELDQLVADRYISVQRHPQAPLRIYNYAPKTQWERAWGAATLACRGLIVNDDGLVVARPFTKFFNLGEHDGPLPAEPFEVYEKLDGSLGVLYWVGDTPYIATRGSFISDQARRATAILHTRYAQVWPLLDRTATYLFEIILPENRIVVHYGDRADIVLLAIIDTATGADRPLPDIGFPVVPHHDGLTEINAVLAIQESNREGFVLRFASGLRLKVKMAEYLRLHRIITGVTPRRVWEVLRAGDEMDAWLDNVPDEFGAWVRSTADGLRQQFDAIEAQCQTDFARRPDGDRRTIALAFQQCAQPSVLFAMLDGKPYADAIWKQLRPASTEPFREDEA